MDPQFQQALEAAKLEAMAEFAAGAGHEINNPLTVISGRAQLLLRDEVDPERRRTLALIVAQASRIYEMIADLMLFARPPSPELQQIELVALVDEIIGDLAPRCEEHEIAICRGGQSGPIMILADAVQLRVALRAVCQNSMEAIGRSGRIEIAVEAKSPSCSTDDTQNCPHARVGETETAPSALPQARNAVAEQRCQALIRIRDDGPGLKPEERQHIFDPFYSARQAGRGLGLGLSKAWRIITNHGGQIDVESRPGQGATFTIRLPAAVT
jgi:signal transduction histidine kinase